jgi:gas vesicle protein
MTQSRGNESKSVTQIIVRTLAIAAVGYVVGILVAPKKGRDMRRHIADKARRTKEEFQQAVEE